MKSEIFTAKLNEKVTIFKDQMRALRVGSFHIDSLGILKVRAYGSEMTLQEVANLTLLAPNEVLVDPWDKSIVAEVEQGLRQINESGFSVVAEGDKLRLKASDLTSERREALSKEVGRKKEEVKVAVRLIRQDQMRSLDEMEENGEISEDDKFRQREEVEAAVKKVNEEIESVAKVKQEQLARV